MDQSETDINRKRKSLHQPDGTLGLRQKKSNTLATCADNLLQDDPSAIAWFDQDDSNISSFGRSTDNVPPNSSKTLTQVQQSDVSPLGISPSTVASPGRTKDRDMLDQERTGIQVHAFEHSRGNHFENSYVNITGRDLNLTQYYYSEYS
ncbi:hypothetical protein K435DRAFT_812826 [Dendrothele bispora CBS 962.96]|uniref:Uncharacterized protein n=1 Tax=Dendrothele bispora (strain CBS 962.96) TaxID=1314807 RepID=A0A4S8KN40_DENBC|nr:hypothetical protein K435DRAFT_812826 [Dendrothele bispora CBS 962.96]